MSAGVILARPATSGTVALNVATVTSSPFTVTGEDVVLVNDDTAGATTVNLPAAAAVGRVVRVKKLGTTGDVTVDGDTTETIDDGLTATLTVQYESISLVSDGTEWHIV